MKRFGGGKKFGDKPSFRRPRFSGGDRDKPVMHRATCSKCNKPCEVPFRPSGNKPVLCLTCYKAEGGGASGKFERKSFDSHKSPPIRLPDPRPAMDEMIKINAKLDKILKILDPEIK